MMFSTVLLYSCFLSIFSLQVQMPRVQQTAVQQTAVVRRPPKSDVRKSVKRKASEVNEKKGEEEVPSSQLQPGLPPNKRLKTMTVSFFHPSDLCFLKCVGFYYRMGIQRMGIQRMGIQRMGNQKRTGENSK
jgi:hypothetical protein